MDSAPLNMAHFHERRAEKYMKHHRYDEAHKAIETSLHYLDDAYRKVTLAKSIEVLDTQKWDYLRKLAQIQMRKQQYERLKHKDSAPQSLPPLCEAVNNACQMRSDSVVSAQLAAKSIDKTVKDFDMKFTSLLEHGLVLNNKENREPPTLVMAEPQSTTMPPSPPRQQQQQQQNQQQQVVQQPQQQQMPQQATNEVAEECCGYDFGDNDEMPSLAPLELPAFDFTVLTASAPSLATMADLAENFQK